MSDRLSKTIITGQGCYLCYTGKIKRTTKYNITALHPPRNKFLTAWRTLLIAAGTALMVYSSIFRKRKFARKKKNNSVETGKNKNVPNKNETGHLSVVRDRPAERTTAKNISGSPQQLHVGNPRKGKYSMTSNLHKYNYYSRRRVNSLYAFVGKWRTGGNQDGNRYLRKLITDVRSVPTVTVGFFSQNKI